MYKNLLRKTYRSLPYKQHLFKVVRRSLQPSEKIFKHLSFEGDFLVPIDEKHSFLLRHYGYQIENEIFWGGLTGGWERRSMAIWIELVKDASVVVDVGANTGVYALVAKALNPGAEVIAFEPVERVFSKLIKNVEINSFDITCEPVALSNYDGKATIYDQPGDHILSVTVNKNLAESNAEVIPTEVETRRLDTYFRGRSPRQPVVMKIDVETHEPEVLEGFGHLLNEHRPAMLIEILNNKVAARIESLVSGIGYRFFNIDDESDSVREVGALTRSDYFNYLVCTDETVNKVVDALDAAGI